MSDHEEREEDGKRERAEDKAKRKDPDTFKNWQVKCTVCDGKPTMGRLGLCGPCATGEAETVNGNW